MDKVDNIKPRRIDLNEVYTGSHPYIIEVYKDNEFLGYSNGLSDWCDKLNTITPHIDLNNGSGYAAFSSTQILDAITDVKRRFHRDGYIFKVLDTGTKSYISEWSDITAEEKYKFILYLDMDGVTASTNYIVKIHDAFVGKNDNINKDFEYRNFMQQWCFQKEAVEFLNRLYDIAPYTIILTTTRRYELNLAEWNLIYRLNNIKANIDGITNKISRENHISWRESEIKEYHFRDRDVLTTLKNMPFLIIDDDNFDLMTYTDKLIHVNTETGLTMEYLEETKQKLKNQNVELKENIEDGK